MTLMSAPRTPAVAVARELRRLGLEQGRGKDFRVVGHYVNRERQYSYVLLLTRRADEVVAENADRIEEWTAMSGFPFRVDVRYPGGLTRPVASVRNGGGPRVREELPAVEEPAVEEAPAVEVAEEAPADEDAPQTYADKMRDRAQASALGWSTKHAEMMTAARAGELVVAVDGSARHITRPGRTGRRVNADRLVPLTGAGFLTITDPGPDGARPVRLTADGRRALIVFERVRPATIERHRKKETQPLRPLAGGQEARRRSAALEADNRRRAAERELFYAELDVRNAAEEFEDRCWDAWASVQDVTHRLGRNRPEGWAPTDEEAALYGLREDVVEALREEAAVLAGAYDEEGQDQAEDLAPAGVDEEALLDALEELTPAATCDDAGECNLTLQHEDAMMFTKEGAGSSGSRGGTDAHVHDPLDRGRRPRHRGPRHGDDRGRWTRRSHAGVGRRGDDVGRGPRPDPHRVRPPHRQRAHAEAGRHQGRSDGHRDVLRPRRHPDRLTVPDPAGRPLRPAPSSPAPVPSDRSSPHATQLRHRPAHRPA